MKNEEETMGPKLAMLAKLQGYTQTQLAEACGISRVSINRFFNGKTALKATELGRLLRLVGIDLEQQINSRLLATPEN